MCAGVLTVLPGRSFSLGRLSLVRELKRNAYLPFFLLLPGVYSPFVFQWQAALDDHCALSRIGSARGAWLGIGHALSGFGYETTRLTFPVKG